MTLTAIFLAATMASSTQNPVAPLGDYRVELRIPPGGIYAGSEIDIEFRITDPRLDDPILGPAGVPNLNPKAIITMPEMPGMPPATPRIHRESVPGDYGIEAFFPHGGEYQILISLPDTPRPAAFTVNVADGPPRGATVRLPFRLQTTVTPATAGVPALISSRVIDATTDRAVTAFDIAHEQEFHMLIASANFDFFLHEHPVMAADGTWNATVTLPYGGDYWVYGDVAPRGRGSQILASRIRVAGPKSPARPDWRPNLGPVVTQGVAGVFAFVDPPQVGKSGITAVRLTVDGQPVTDLEKWLGAWAHLMIFSPDGLTVVHSHPDEDPAADALAAGGEIRFRTRFPRPGPYRAYVQFQRHGQVHTLSFTVEVRP